MNVSNKTGDEILDIQVTISEGSIKYLGNGQGDEITKAWKENNLNLEQKIGSTAVHEFDHATKDDHLKGLRERGGITSSQHQSSTIIEKAAINDYGDFNKAKQK